MKDKKDMKFMSLKLSQNQHKNLEIIAKEYRMTKAQVAIACIDLGCQSIAKIGELKVKEMAGLSKAFASMLGEFEQPEIAPQDEDNT